MKPIVQDWVCELDLRKQGVLVLALRGPDGTPKESGAKPIIRALRACVMRPAFTDGRPLALGEYDGDDPFMSMRYISSEQEWNRVSRKFFDDLDSYNIHFFNHLADATAICGYFHKEPIIAQNWLTFYTKCCTKQHKAPESFDTINYRLRDGRRDEDRDERLERRA